MVGTKVLVFGGTGPAGICLLRELIHRKHETIAYCRSPSKIPSELVDSPLLEVIKGELDDINPLTEAVSKCNKVISLLGPNQIRLPSPTLFADFYTKTLFPLLITHDVQSIYAMGTLSISVPAMDSWSLKRGTIVWLVWAVANSAWHNIINVGKAFEGWDCGSGEGRRVEWTVFRIGAIPGGSGEEDWKRDREGLVFAGGIGQEGWTMGIRRSRLARWLVDYGVEGEGAGEWVGKMPAVTRMANSK